MAFAAVAVLSKKVVMPWMGLERTGERIIPDLAQIAQHLKVVSRGAAVLPFRRWMSMARLLITLAVRSWV